MVGDTDNHEASYFLLMYLRDSRAIDYIRTCAPTGTGKLLW